MKNHLFIEHRNYFLIIALSFLIFLIKGIDYLIIGSMIPLIIVIAIMILILAMFYFFKIKGLKVGLRFWAILLVLWGGFRGLITFFIYFELLTEEHLKQQVSSVFGLLLSIFILGLGGYICKKSKKLI